MTGVAWQPKSIYSSACSSLVDVVGEARANVGVVLADDSFTLAVTVRAVTAVYGSCCCAGYGFRSIADFKQESDLHAWLFLAVLKRNQYTVNFSMAFTQSRTYKFQMRQMLMVTAA